MIPRRGLALSWGLVALLVLSHVWIARLREPMTAASADAIHAPSAWRDATTRQLQVSTFNIHRAQDASLQAIADALRPDDVAALQEVLAAGWTGSGDQAEQIARRIDTGWLFAPTQSRHYRPYYGNALLSRFPVRHWRREPLVWSDRLGETDRSRRFRNRIRAEIELGGTVVTVFVTHLDRGAVRVQQLANALSELEQVPPAVLLGDLNTHRNNAILTDWLARHPGADAIRSAMGDADPRDRVDWILALGFDVLGGGMEEGLSDHPRFWVQLSLDRSQ